MKRRREYERQEKGTIRSVLLLLISLSAITILLGCLYVTVMPKLRRQVTEKVMEQMISGSMGGSVSYRELVNSMEEQDKIQMEDLVERYATDENITALLKIYDNSDGNIKYIENDLKKIMEPEDMDTVYYLMDKYGK